MIYYIYPLLSGIVIKIKNSKEKKIILSFLFLFLFLFLTTTYYNGSDWRQYELMFKYPENYTRYTKKGEILFIPYLRLWKKIVPQFILCLIGTKMMSLYLYNKSLKRYTNKKELFYILFLPIAGLYLYIDNPLRQMIAISISVYSIKFIYQRKFKKYLLTILIGATFHVSILLTLFFYWVNLKKIKNKTIIISTLILTILILIPGILEHIIESTKIIPVIYIRLHTYLDTKYGVQSIKELLSIGMLEKLILLIVFLYYRKKIYRYKKYGRLVWDLSLVSIIMYIVAKKMDILVRLKMYLDFFYILNIIYFYELIKGKILKNLLLLFFVLYSCVLITKLINSRYVYKPYTNYLWHKLQGKEDLPYTYRAHYHYIYHNVNFKKRGK